MKLKLKARVNSSDDQTTRQALDQLAAKSSATKEGDEFIVRDLRKRTAGRYQVTSDQYNGYVGAMREHFGQNVDFGQLHKIYGRINTDGWYGGGQVIGAVPHVKIGRPEWSRISTSHVERTNLSVRMHLRRFYATDERAQQDTGEHASGSDPIHRVLQLLPCSRFAESHACHAIWHRKPRLEHPRVVEIG